MFCPHSLFIDLSKIDLRESFQCAKQDNKDDSIHKSKALKSEDKDKQKITLIECQNLISRTLIFKSKQNCVNIGHRKGHTFSFGI